MGESTSAQSNEPDNHEGENDEFYGLLQFSCGLPTPVLSKSAGSVVSRAVTVGDVEERRRTLRSWLIPPGKDFDLHLLTKIFEGAEVDPPHTWLLALSRHTAVKLHDFSPRLADGPLPTGFPQALDWHRASEDVSTPWTHYLRVQRARDDSSRRFTDETDCNDFLIRDSKLANSGRDGLERGSLDELQLFFCEFLAQRRGAIFASHVSERIYNVWLPPGIITPGERRNPGDLNKPLAVLPVVTVVRRPYRIDWRYALSVTIFLVPWPPEESELPSHSDQRPPRAMTAREMVHVITSTSGNSTYLRDHGRLTWTLQDSPLSRYLHRVTDDDLRDFCHSYVGAGNPDWGAQPLRHWIELLLMTVAETPKGREERDNDRLPEQQQVDDQILPDEVLRCLRVNGLWSALMLTDSFPASTDGSPMADGRWWHEGALPTPAHIGDLTAGMPRPLSALFGLFADRNRGFAPTPSDRLDGLSYGGRSYATWLMPDENIMITAYSLADDKFPSFSSLYQIGWFAYMAVGVTCAWQTMYSLTHDTDRLRDVAELSRLGHDRILDLEDVYEFDVAWPAYAQFYRRVRKLLGVDSEYTEIEERIDQLFRFAQAEQRARDERIRKEEIRLGGEEQQLASRSSHVVEGGAAIAGALLLLVSLGNVVIDAHQDLTHVGFLAAFAGSVLIALIAVIGFLVLRSRVRKVDDDRERTRAALARVASSSAPDHPRR